MLIMRYGLISMIALIFLLFPLMGESTKERAQCLLLGVVLIPLAVSTFISQEAYIASLLCLYVLSPIAQLVYWHWEAVLRRG